MTGIFLRATAVTWGWNRYRTKGQHRKMTLEKKFSRHSCRDSNPGPFNHESDALTTKLSPHPWPLLWAFEGVLRGALAYHNLLIAVRFVLIMDKLFHTIFACIFLSVLCDHSYFVLSWWINLGGGDSSVVRAPDSWLKGRGFESLLERRENFLLQGRLSVLTLISVSVPPPCYHSST